MLRWIKDVLFWVIGIGGHQNSSIKKGEVAMEDDRPLLEKMSAQELQITAAEIEREMQDSTWYSL